MKHYEILYIIPHSFTDEEAPVVGEKVKEMIIAEGGQITLEDTLGKKKLAYPIKNIHHGYYILYEFDLEPEKLKTIKDKLTLTAEVLRFMIVTKKKKTSKDLLKEKEIAEKIEAKKEKTEKEEAEKEKATKPKVDLKDLDKKLDELLDTEEIL